MAGQEHGALDATGYISHHLQHWATGHQKSMIDFSVFHWDTFIWSTLMGVLGLGLMYMAARKVTSGVPGRFQAFVEMLIEMVDNQAKGVIHGDRSFIAPMALTVFVWIVLMNALDFLPVDLPGKIIELTGLHLNEHNSHRIVPTADLNGTLGISLGVILLVFYYNLKIKGVGGFAKEVFTGHMPSNGIVAKILLALPNLLLSAVEYVAKTVSLAMRLFGNMYAGEMVFLLIALLGAAWHGPSIGGFLGMVGHVIAGSLWAIFHILIIVLQAFIFMMLTLIYLGQAHDHH